MKKWERLVQKFGATEAFAPEWWKKFLETQ